ncbi:MAG: COX15/CtaA family protein [Phycisphaerales bacterium]|nr:COX15/CtaA family protein [Phycisphaerales bacterium]
MSATLPSPVSREHPVLAAGITMGFATAVAMWAVGFITHIPAWQASPPVVGMLLLAVQAAGAVVTGWVTGSRFTLRIGAVAGLMAGLINLALVLPVVATSHGPNQLHSAWALVVAGAIVFSTVLGAVGAAIGGLLRGEAGEALDSRGWLARFGVVAAVAAVPVLFSGGLVTSARAGLAVPDWPTSYGANMFLYPLAKMTGGIYYEHAHRLFGSLVGLTTLSLLVFTLLRERRAWVKAVVVAAFLAVCVQGVLGGLRVRWAQETEKSAAIAASVGVTPESPLPDRAVATDFAITFDDAKSTSLAMVHGISGQLTFALLCAVAAFLALRWRQADAGPGPADPLARNLAILTFALLVMQLTLGAALRHFHHGHALLAHIAMALAVTVTAIMAGMRAAGRHRQAPPLRLFGMAVAHTVILQFLLGWATFAAVFPYSSDKQDQPLAVAVATLHQVTGAALLGFGTLLLCWTLRLVAASQPDPSPAPAVPA